MKTATRSSLTAVLAIIVACSTDGGPGTQPTNPSGLSVNPGVDTAFVADTVPFAALDSLPASLGPVTWTVSDSRVAVIERQIGESAFVRAIHQGTTTVTAAKGSHTASGVLVVEELVAAKLVFTAQPTNASSTSSLTPPVAVTIENHAGHPVPSATNEVTIAIGTNPGHGTLSGTKVLSATAGVATFAALSIDKVGTGYTLTASALGLAGTTSTAFDVVAGPAVRLVFTAQPSDANAGVAIGPVKVTAQDAGGNTATGFTATITIAIGANPAGGTLSGTKTIAAVGGTATFADLSIDKAGPGYTLQATSGTVTPAASAQFTITTLPTALHVTTTTTGAAIPAAGYSVCVDPFSSSYSYGCGFTGPIGVNGAVTAPVATGSHSVELDNVPRNCALTGDTANPRTVAANGTTEVPFVVSCLDTGTVRVTVATTGADVDPDGYYVCIAKSVINCFWSARLQVNDVIAISGVTAEQHAILIGDVAGNCTVSGGTTKSVTVVAHSTTTASFTIGCVLAERIAFTSFGTITVMRVDRVGALVSVTHGFSPAWSADGTRLAYECDLDICAISPDGSGFAQLTTDAASNRHPTWSPDGSKIAFSKATGGVPDLWVMAADGSGAVRLTQNAGFVGSPAWSPDGTKIAFDCQVDAANDDICVVNADGTGFARLTNDPARDYGAAWKRDGSTLAFATTRFGADEIVLMSSAGGAASRIGSGLPGSEPTWSPDGTQLAFVRLDQSGRPNILTAHTDGSNLLNVVIGDEPAWKPHP